MRGTNYYCCVHTWVCLVKTWHNKHFYTSIFPPKPHTNKPSDLMSNVDNFEDPVRPIMWKNRIKHVRYTATSDTRRLSQG